MTPVSRSIGHTLLSLVVLQKGLARTQASVWCLEGRTTFVVFFLIELIYILYVWHTEPCTYKLIGLDHLCCDMSITRFPVFHMA